MLSGFFRNILVSATERVIIYIMNTILFAENAHGTYYDLRYYALE